MDKEFLEFMWDMRKIIVKEKVKIKKELNPLQREFEEKEALIEKLEEKSKEGNGELAQKHNSEILSVYEERKKTGKVSSYLDVITFRLNEMSIDVMVEELEELRRRIQRLLFLRFRYKILSDAIWFNAIFKDKGNIDVELKNFNNEKLDYEFHLETGEVFQP